MAAAVMAQAQSSSPSISVTNDLLYQRNFEAVGVDGARRPNQFQEHLSLFLTWGQWSGGLTVRDVNYYKAYGDTTLDQADASLYRAYAKFVSGGFSVQVGDFNAVLGRGMVLSVVQNDTVLLDWTIRGLDVRYLGKGADFHALMGTVNNHIRRLPPGTMVSGLPLAEGFRKWNVAGLEGQIEWMKGNRVGARAALIEDDGTESSLTQTLKLVAGNPPRPNADRRVSESLNLAGNGLWGVFDYYVEAAQTQFRQKQETPWTLPWPRPTDPTRGSGLYGNMVFHSGAWMVMAEGKRYRHFNNELNNAPLADRETEKLTMDNSDGLRLYAHYSFRDPDLTLFASAGRCREGDLLSKVVNDGSSVFGGFKLEDWFDRLGASYTYGLKTVHLLVGRYLEKRTDASLTYKFTPLWSLDFTLKDRRKPNYGEWDLTTQVARSPWGALYFTHQYSSRVETPDNPSPWKRMNSGGIRINLKKGSYLDLSGGKMRGGEVCAGGQCVMLPAYRGWKISTHIRF
ncbi:MAG: hypothetical protein LWX11_11760 [Firmicutes bacterium]|nr:hypothetical protein [Bacillota bacterium]